MNTDKNANDITNADGLDFSNCISLYTPERARRRFVKLVQEHGKNPETREAKQAFKAFAYATNLTPEDVAFAVHAAAL